MPLLEILLQRVWSTLSQISDAVEGGVDYRRKNGEWGEASACTSLRQASAICARLSKFP